ncbi:hypothetical protein G5Y03_001096 [Vibrio parahaemolyticus]|nr:hypothetical protein [Vibrio parahaemolyticus]
MNLDNIPEEFAKMIDEELNKNHLVHSMYSMLNDAGLNNSCDNEEYLSKGLCLLLMQKTRDLEEQLLDLYARQTSPQPIFLSTPNTPDEFFIKKFKEEQSEDWCKASSSTRIRMLSHKSGIELRHHRYNLDAIKSLHSHQSLYLSQMYSTLHSLEDLVELIREARSNAEISIHGKLKIEISAESFGEFKRLIEGTPVKPTDHKQNGNEFCECRIVELPKRTGKFIGVCYDFDLGDKNEN